jgi:hypothetical protein
MLVKESKLAEKIQRMRVLELDVQNLKKRVNIFCGAPKLLGEGQPIQGPPARSGMQTPQSSLAADYNRSFQALHQLSMSQAPSRLQSKPQSRAEYIQPPMGNNIMGQSRKAPVENLLKKRPVQMGGKPALIDLRDDKDYNVGKRTIPPDEVENIDDESPDQRPSMHRKYHK